MPDATLRSAKAVAARGSRIWPSADPRRSMYQYQYRSEWSTWRLQHKMAISLGSRQAADEEARAEVEVLNSRLEKTTQLTKKIQASLARLESSGRSVQDAVGPLFGNTQKLQTLGTNIDAVLSAIDRIRQPSDIKSNEEDVIRKGPKDAGLSAFLSSMKRVNKALSEMQQTNLRSNQQAAADLSRLLKSGNTQLESYVKSLLQDNSRPVEPLHYITKDKPFPLLSQDITSPIGLIASFVASTLRQSNTSGESPIVQAYASVRGPYLTSTLQNLAFASVNTARKQTPDAVYRQGTNGMGTYARGMEGIFLAEYDNIRVTFARDDIGKALNLTCQGAISELARTLRELNTHIKTNLTTDCYLAYEIIEIMTNLSSSLDGRTGELKPSFASALKPIRETAKWSLGELLDDTRRRINSSVNIPLDAAAVPITSEVMTRLQTMTDFLRPISSIMISIGDGGWRSGGPSNSSDQIPSLSSFDIGADGKQIFAHYSTDTIDTLLSTLEQKGKSALQKSKGSMGVFIANNATVVDRMIRNSDLQPLLSSRMTEVEKWRKSGTQMYTMTWREPSAHLLDVQYTNRGSQRPPSGSAAAIDSAAILRGLSSKDKDAIKDKFRLFNTSFDELVVKHKSMTMEREVRETLARQVQQMIEPLYGRFWDRYHEVDKGKGKYVKYDKASISAVFIGLG